MIFPIPVLFYAVTPVKNSRFEDPSLRSYCFFKPIPLGRGSASSFVMSIKKRVIFAIAGLTSFFVPGPAAEPVQYRYAVADSNTEAHYTPVITQRRRRYARRRYYTASRPRYVVRRRSKAKSAAIIGGSAAAGAGIGALAGGGKGAGIGAIAGGAAGLIYDRKTHKKVVREY